MSPLHVVCTWKWQHNSITVPNWFFLKSVLKMTIIGNLLVTMKQLVTHLKEVLNEKHLQSIEETTANYFLLDQYRLFNFYSKKLTWIIIQGYKLNVWNFLDNFLCKIYVTTVFRNALKYNSTIAVLTWIVAKVCQSLCLSAWVQCNPHKQGQCHLVISVDIISSKQHSPRPCKIK